MSFCVCVSWLFHFNVVKFIILFVYGLCFLYLSESFHVSLANPESSAMTPCVWSPQTGRVLTVPPLSPVAPLHLTPMSPPLGMSLLQAIRVNITYPSKFLQTLSQWLILSLFFLSFFSPLPSQTPKTTLMSILASLYSLQLCADLDLQGWILGLVFPSQHCACTWENWFLDLAAEVLCLSCVINRNIKLFITFTKCNIKAIKRLLQHNIEIIAGFITQTP